MACPRRGAAARERCRRERARRVRPCRRDEPLLRRARTRRRAARRGPRRLLELGSRGAAQLRPLEERRRAGRQPIGPSPASGGADADAGRRRHRDAAGARVRAARHDGVRLPRLRRRCALPSLAGRARRPKARDERHGQPALRECAVARQYRGHRRGPRVDAAAARRRSWSLRGDSHRQRQRCPPDRRGGLPVPPGFPARADGRQSQLGERHPRPCPPPRCGSGLYVARRRPSRR